MDSECEIEEELLASFQKDLEESLHIFNEGKGKLLYNDENALLMREQVLDFLVSIKWLEHTEDSRE